MTTQETTHTYIIDGRRFSTLDGFYEEIDRIFMMGNSWGHNLDAFNDILRGGMGTPDGKYHFIWQYSDHSRHALRSETNYEGIPIFDELVSILQNNHNVI